MGAYQLGFERLVSYDVGAEGIGIDITLRLTTDVVRLAAMIDTGATYCVFEHRFGVMLGLDVESGMRQRFGSATGSFYAYGHSVELGSAGFEFNSVVFFAEDESFSRNVLGRIGWLDRLVVGLVDYEAKLFLGKYND